MGGVVGDVVSGIGDIGQGAIDAVSDLGASIDDTVNEVIPGGWTTAALLTAGYYYAPEIGAYINASGSTVPASAVIDAGATDASLGAAGAANASAGGFTLPAIPPEVSAVSNANSVVNAVSGGASSVPSAVTTAGEMTAQQTAEMIAKEQAASTGLLGSVGSALGNLSTAQQIGLGAAALGATGALGGSTPSSSTTTSSIDPDVKAAYLRNLEEARTVGAGLGARQFAEFPEYNLGMVQNYMNPYENIVVQNTLADIERARQGQISAEGARATAAGAFGGTRQAVTRSLVDEAALRNAGNLAAQLRQGGFAQAQNLGLSQEALRQQYEQSKLDAARGLPLERLNIAQGALSLQPARIGESTTKPIYTNPVASGFGGALGGAQLGSLIGGKESGSEYAAYGAGLGGLLGFLG
jgi:hypothetical protein